jgi:hypothetical protein
MSAHGTKLPNWNVVAVGVKPDMTGPPNSVENDPRRTFARIIVVHL